MAQVYLAFGDFKNCARVGRSGEDPVDAGYHAVQVLWLSWFPSFSFSFNFTIVPPLEE
jgi:hypothetical protein